MSWTVGHDPSRSGWAWAVATEERPLGVYWVATSGLRDPWGALATYMDEIYRPTLAQVIARGAPVLVAVEHPVAVHAGRARALQAKLDAEAQALEARVRQGQASGADVGRLKGLRGRSAAMGGGNAQATAKGLGMAIGPILVETARAGRGGGLAGVVEVTPPDWRAWMGVGGSRLGAEVLKANAIAIATRSWPSCPVDVAVWRGGLRLDRYTLRDLPEPQREGACEAALIAVGAARNRAALLAA